MKKLIVSFSLLFATMAHAKIITPIYSTDGKHTLLGHITLSDSAYGVMIQPELHNLSPGMHGLHIHVNPSCQQQGMAAGGHWDPQKTGKHLGPYSDEGHLGDLPVMYVDKNGIANTPTLAPRIHLNQISSHALMIHQHGDNYADTPKSLGGGGVRVACGVIAPN
ncbi:MAG: superoxide dismutase [Legionellales bacterium]|nr:superoxide dismutase [Legionellales bacterium]